MLNCIAIGGVPASGKSYLINALYNNLDNHINFKSGLIRGHYIKKYNLLIVGIYNTFKKFKGTDLLSMSVHNDFKQLIALNKYIIIRQLNNKRIIIVIIFCIACF